jgi:hypothetical protein
VEDVSRSQIPNKLFLKFNKFQYFGFFRLFVPGGSVKINSSSDIEFYIYTPIVKPFTTTVDLRIDYVADYFPYGKVLREYVNGQAERYLTTQHERDQETGLDYRGS